MSLGVSCVNAFPIDVTLKKDEICNLENEQTELIDLAKNGKRVVIFGRRNTGKTSIILNVIIPQMLKANKHAVCVFVDFMGVDSQADVEIRLNRAIEFALVRAYPGRKFLSSLMDVAKSFRPILETDALTGSTSISITYDPTKKTSHLEFLISKLAELHQSTNVFLAFDEFQDIASVRQMTALFRNALQLLPKDLPVFICGSKKHLLVSMFGPHKAPFAGWGRDLEIPTIRSHTYLNKYYDYASTRLLIAGIKVDIELFAYLVDQCDGIPEAVNILLENLLRSNPGKTLHKEDIIAGLCAVIDERRGRFEEQLLRFRSPEKLVLTLVAKHGPIKHPKGKDFLSLVRSLSPSTIFNAIRQLELNADIYSTDLGFVVSDPLLGIFLRRYR
jgi:hypothetical protein